MKKTILILMTLLAFSAFNSNATTISYIDGILEYPSTNHEIYINGIEPFSAYLTNVTADPRYSVDAFADVFFFLFDSTMRLVAWDDDSGMDLIPWTPKIYEESLKSGSYYLYVAWPNIWPMDNEGMLADLPWQIGYGLPRPPLSDGSLEYWQYLSSWFNNGMWTNISSYTLALEGARPIPEPTTMLLFGTGAIGLTVLRIRRKKN